MNIGDTIVLKGTSSKGKEIIRRDGEIWCVIPHPPLVLRSTVPGTCIQSETTGEWRWLNFQHFIRVFR